MIVRPDETPTGRPSRTRVKICGLTRPPDARRAAQLGADALGVVFAPGPRRIDVDRAVEVFSAAPGTIERVGVFVDPTLDFLRETALACRLDWIQLSGHEPEELAAAVPCRIIKAVHVRSREDLISAAGYPADAFLLDAPAPGNQMGGTGKTFDWSAAERLPWPPSRVIVAGGLTPENVGSAIERLRPGGVDVSSGVEAGPGEKDPAKMEAFLAAVGEADSRLRGIA